MGAFWSHGFERTTLAELERVTGVDRSTLYNSFDGKAGLYLESALAYVEAVEAELLAPLYAGPAGLDDIAEFLNQLAARLQAGRDPAGCLIVNDLAAPLPNQRAATRYLTALSGGFRAALARAVHSGELAESTVDARCRVLVAAVLGALVTHRHDAPDPRAATAALAALRAMIETWRQ